MRNVVFVLVLAVLAVVMIPVVGWSQEWPEETQVPAVSTTVCSLDWGKLRESFLGWMRVGPPTVTTNEVGVPLFQTDILLEIVGTSDASRIAIVVADWGDSESKKLGNVLFCNVFGPDGVTLESVGEDPLKKTMPTSVQKIKI